MTNKENNFGPLENQNRHLYSRKERLFYFAFITFLLTAAVFIWRTSMYSLQLELNNFII
jgi:hypothetical protein